MTWQDDVYPIHLAGGLGAKFLQNSGVKHWIDHKQETSKWGFSSPKAPMELLSFVPLFSACFLISTVFSVPPLFGIHPLDYKYFASDIIKCKDGSNSFTRDRINDNFCDCLDGTDEPGTSACPMGKFYCRNVGSTPRFLFSSRVNDRICDCCDGSDENDGSILCPNTCIMGGNVLYRTKTHNSKVSTLDSVDAKESKSGISMEDLIQKLKGLKVVLILQVVLIGFLVSLRLFHRKFRSKRRHYR